mgnify:FL=1
MSKFFTEEQQQVLSMAKNYGVELKISKNGQLGVIKEIIRDRRPNTSCTFLNVDCDINELKEAVIHIGQHC